MLLVTAASAVIPSILLIWYFWARDLQPEPGRVLAATFGLGVGAIIPALMVELALAPLIKHLGDPYLRGAVEGFLGAAAPEELFKLVVLLAFCVRHPAFDEPTPDSIVYGAVASLGFATLREHPLRGRRRPRHRHPPGPHRRAWPRFLGGDPGVLRGPGQVLPRAPRPARPRRVPPRHRAPRDVRQPPHDPQRPGEGSTRATAV